MFASSAFRFSFVLFYGQAVWQVDTGMAPIFLSKTRAASHTTDPLLSWKIE